MAVTFDQIAFDEIEVGLRFVLSQEFKNVYISNEFTMMGNECIRINLESSDLVSQMESLEVRDYNVIIRYYHIADMSNEPANASVKARLDMLRKLLVDNKTNGTYNWSEVRVESIEYNVEDEENEDMDNLHIAEYSVSITHHNIYNA